MSALDIRLAAPEEHAAVDALVAEAYAFDYGPRNDDGDEMRHARARAERFDVWVAADPESGQLLGSVTTTRAQGENLMEDAGANELTFRLLAVSPHVRRRGVGTALIRHTIALAQARGDRRVFLKSAPNMHGAHELYVTLGFRRDPGRDGLVIAQVKTIDLYAFAFEIIGGVEATRREP